MSKIIKTIEKGSGMNNIFIDSNSKEGKVLVEVVKKHSKKET